MRKFSFLFICLFFAIAASAQVTVKNVLCEYLQNPIGIDIAQPRFSWQLQSDRRNVQQTAYELVINNTAAVGRNAIWNSGKVNSSQSVHVRYAGPALQSGKRYFWQVRVWDNTGKVSAWSEPAYWEMGLRQESDWKGKWIGRG